jgi:L,D-transpeptidase ErfK/SrfK
VRLYIKLLLVLLLFGQSYAASYNYIPNSKDIVGEIRSIQAEKNDTMMSIARRYDVGLDELVLVNSNINPYSILPGTVIILPTQFILPNAPHKGVVVNLPERRMYFFRHNKVLSFPIGIGKVGWATPVGKMRIISRAKNPTWRIPESVWQEQYNVGNVLPKTIPPGPDNPLGNYALRLSKSNYLIHGTNAPEGVGQRVSAGCLRMYPRDIKQLYHILPKNTAVNIVNQPLKFAVYKNQLFVESHPPLNESIDDRNLADGIDTSTPRTLAEAVQYTFDKIEKYDMEPILARDIHSIINASNGIPSVVANK